MSKLKEFLNPLEPSCPTCPKSIVVQDQREGQHVCTECGLVLGPRIIAEGSEWRTFSDSHDSRGVDMNRVGGPANPLLGEEAGLSTQVGRVRGGDGPGSGNIAKYHDRIGLDTAQHALLKAFGSIQNFCDRLGLKKNINDITCELYKQVHDSRELRGRGKNVIITTCIYMACKIEDVPRTLKELCAEFEIRKRDVGRCYKKIMKLKKEGKLKITTKPKRGGGSLSEKFMMRFCSQLKLPPVITNLCSSVAGLVSKYGICDGKTPAAVAAASIFLVTQLASCHKPVYRRTAQSIAHVAHIAEGTVKSAYSQIYQVRAKLFIPENLDKKDPMITTFSIEGLPYDGVGAIDHPPPQTQYVEHQPAQQVQQYSSYQQILPKQAPAVPIHNFVGPHSTSTRPAVPSQYTSLPPPPPPPSSVPQVTYQPMPQPVTHHMPQQMAPMSMNPMAQGMAQGYQMPYGASQVMYNGYGTMHQTQR